MNESWAIEDYLRDARREIGMMCDYRYSRLMLVFADPVDAARGRALAFLGQRIAMAVPTRWEHPADILVRILTLEKRHDEAWTVARAGSTSPGARQALARASEATHPAEAIETYAGRIAGLVNGGTNPGYAEAAELVARMAKLRGPAEQAAHVADLKARFGRKRYFMKLLP